MATMSSAVQTARGRRLTRRAIAPYVLLAPGLLWLAFFYVYPAIQMFLVSLWTGNEQSGYELPFNFGIYGTALSEYWPWIPRSIEDGGAAPNPPFAPRRPPAPPIPVRGGAPKK